MDGAVEGVHAARIATRRIRELLPLTAEWHRPGVVERLHQGFRAVGRALGRVRDTDVRILLLTDLEPRIPNAAPLLVSTRQEQQRRRLQLMRKLIKQLEQDRLFELMNEALTRRRVGVWGRGSGHRWRQELESALGERSRSVADAIRHATGVYFPHRTHSARIAIKKLRYALEIAEATSTRWATDVIPDLKNAQDILGDLHDRQELVDDLADAVPSSDPAITLDQLILVTRIVEADILELHARYLACRSALLAIAETPPQLRDIRRAPRPLMIAAGALALSSGLMVAQTSWRRRA